MCIDNNALTISLPGQILYQFTLLKPDQFSEWGKKMSCVASELSENMLALRKGIDQLVGLCLRCFT